MLDLPKGVHEIIKALEAAGYEAYAVGGCIRDSLMGRAAADWDVTTNATPEQVTKVFNRKRVVPTGVLHGTVSVIIKGETFEVTTYRIDGRYSDGRRPDSIRFTASLHEDLSRRDFTINAMAYNPKVGLEDPFDGAQDIKRGIVRCVGQTSERFGEDYLRMMRAYRFSAVLDFELEPSIRQVVLANRNRILDIAAERVRVEFDKLMLSQSHKRFLVFMEDLGPVLFPEIMEFNHSSHAAEVFKHAENDLTQKLCALLHETGKDTTLAIMKRLKYDNARMQAVTGVIGAINTPKAFTRPAVKRLVREKGAGLTREILMFAVADCLGRGEDAVKKEMPIIEGNIKLLEDVLASGEPLHLADLTVNGRDVGEVLGLRSGEAIGSALNYLLEQVQKEPALNEREVLLGILKTRREVEVSGTGEK